MRVSSLERNRRCLGDFLPDAAARAQRLIDFLQEVFETTFSFDLESLQKKGLKQAAKQLARYQAANDYAVSWVVQQSLGGHAIPLDAAALRVPRRLGILEEEGQDLEAVRASLEHQIPKLKVRRLRRPHQHDRRRALLGSRPRLPGLPAAQSLSDRHRNEAGRYSGRKQAEVTGTNWLAPKGQSSIARPITTHG